MKPSLNPMRALRKGEIVQLNPEFCAAEFAGCLMVVTEVRPWGAIGYVQSLGEDNQPGGQAPYRAEWKEMEITFGHVVFIAEDGELKPWELKRGK